MSGPEEKDLEERLGELFTSGGNKQAVKPKKKTETKKKSPVPKQYLALNKKRLYAGFGLLLFSLAIMIYSLFFMKNESSLKNSYWSAETQRNQVGQIISTPLIADMNDDRYKDIVLANRSGILYLLDALSLRQIASVQTGGGVVAPIQLIHRKHSDEKTLWICLETGECQVYDQELDLLYSTRSRLDMGRILGKSLIDDQGEKVIIYTADMEGGVYAFEYEYGKLLWQQNLNAEGQSAFFNGVHKCPWDDKSLLLIASEGQIYQILRENGALIRSFQIKQPVKARPVFSDSKALVFSEKGGIFEISENGANKIQSLPGNEGIVSSPKQSGEKIVIHTIRGKVFYFHIKKRELTLIEREDVQVINGPYLASPALLKLNKNTVPEIINIQQNGHIIAFEASDPPLFFAPHSLPGHFTASALFSDVAEDGTIRAYFFSEEGDVFSLRLNGLRAGKSFQARHSF